MSEEPRGRRGAASKITKWLVGSSSLLVAVGLSSAGALPAASENKCAFQLDTDSSESKRAAEALRSGEAIVVMRHAEATTDGGSPIKVQDASCPENDKYLRRVTDGGKRQLDAIRSGLKKLEAPPFQTLSSPCCRTFQTAKYLQDGGAVEKVESLREGEPSSALLKEILAAKSSGANVLIVTHSSNILEMTGVTPGSTNGDAKAVVLHRSGNPSDVRDSCLGYLMPDDWSNLAQLQQAKSRNENESPSSTFH